MHYYIDGYNLLFRLSRSGDNLRREREQCIQELEARVRLLKLDVTIVFDSYYHPEEGSRTHFNSLKVCFTDEGQTADDFIVDEIKYCLHPTQQIVVTSDRLLGDRCRNFSAQVQTIEAFMTWVNGRYRSRRQQKRKHIISPLSQPIAEIRIAPPVEPVESRLRDSKASIEECFHDYLTEFLKNSVLEAPKQKKAEGGRKQTKSKKRADKEDTPPSKRPLESEEDRWLRLFNKHPK